MVPFQADQGKGHQSSGARDFLAGRSPLRGEGGGNPLAEFFCYWGFWTLPLVSKMVITCVMNIPGDIAAKEAQASSLESSWLVEGLTEVKA